MATKKKKVVKRVRNNKAPPIPKVEQTPEEVKLDWITRAVDGLSQKQVLFGQSQKLAEEYKKEVEVLKRTNYNLQSQLKNWSKEMIKFLSGDQIEAAVICGVTPEFYFFEWLKCCKKNEISFYGVPITVTYTAIKDIR